MKTVQELKKWLAGEADVESISLSEFTGLFRRLLVYNVKNALYNRTRQVKENEMKFCAYKLLRTEKNQPYNKALNAVHEPFVYVVLEEETGYICSNSAKLYLQLRIEQGVSAEDRKQKSLLYRDYMGCVKAFQNGEYE